MELQYFENQRKVNFRFYCTKHKYTLSLDKSFVVKHSLSQETVKFPAMKFKYLGIQIWGNGEVEVEITEQTTDFQMA